VSVAVVLVRLIIFFPSSFVPPNSIIKTADFDGAKVRFCLFLWRPPCTDSHLYARVKALADHLKYLIKNPDKYLE
jgi:hypothetical protein